MARFGVASHGQVGFDPGHRIGWLAKQQPAAMYPSACPPSKESWLPEPELCSKCETRPAVEYGFCGSCLADEREAMAADWADAEYDNRRDA